jgi:uncharacterized protein DUF4350
MRQRLGLIVTIVLVIAVLIAINAASHVSQDEPPDSELAPNRSTYHSGATGTRALYDFLSESGYRVMRWREIPERLLSDRQNVQTFVIVGRTPVEIEGEQAASLALWVERGGRLVLVDREPDAALLLASGNWTFSTSYGNYPTLSTDPADTEQMTEKVTPVQPIQPTLLTQNIESVMPSKFASTISFRRVETKKDNEPPPKQGVQIDEDSEFEFEPAPSPELVAPLDETGAPLSPAPVVHLSYSKGALLLDYPIGKGRIIVLSDPYIFSNSGIALKDNLQLAINILALGDGLIAFDEYHHGKEATRNALIGYFSGTPVIPILGQLALLVLVILWTLGRRFARPLPLVQVDRRSSLEFVASMAELQQRARAFDLAIENIYARTRRVLARYAGTDYNTSRAEIASRVAARSSLDARQLEVLMRQCEDAINGEPISERQTLQLAKRLRDIEGHLGMRMRSRDARQAAQKV